MEPLISVITVTYNAEKTIERTMKSVANQSFRDIEHLIIDGASKDSTLSLIETFKTDQTKILSEPDKGLYDAMNKGLKLAKGRYVIFLNAGDTFHSPETLKHYADKAKEDTDIIYGDTVIVDSDGKFISDRHLSAPDTLTKKSFSNGMLICHQAFMVKKELTGEYNRDYKFSADYDWCVRCINNSGEEKCHNLKEVTIDYLSDGLTDHNKVASLRERFKIMAAHYGIIPTVINHIAFISRTLKRGRI